MDVSIIIINFNTDELTVQAVESVFANEKNVAYEIIVVDNNSNYTNLELLLSNYNNVKFVKLDTNLGFGKANNYGYNLSKGKYIFLLNSDAYLIDDSISRLVEFMEDPKNTDVACCGPNLLNVHGKLNFSYGNFLSKEKLLVDLGLKNIRSIKNKDKLAISKLCDFEKPSEVDYLSGAAIMIRKSMIEKYGLFNPKYFMYYEDMDLCFKYYKNGFKNILLPDVKLVHIGGQSWVKNEFGSYKSLTIILYSKYLFSKNILNAPTALALCFLGYLKSTFNFLKTKAKIFVKKLIK